VIRLLCQVVQNRLRQLRVNEKSPPIYHVKSSARFQVLVAVQT
jgi:hypothetical protein